MDIEQEAMLIVYKMKGFANLKKSYYEAIEEGMKKCDKSLKTNIIELGGKLALLSEMFATLNEKFLKDEEYEFLVQELTDILEKAKVLRNEN